MHVGIRNNYPVPVQCQAVVSFQSYVQTQHSTPCRSRRSGHFKYLASFSLSAQTAAAAETLDSYKPDERRFYLSQTPHFKTPDVAPRRAEPELVNGNASSLMQHSPADLHTGRTGCDSGTA